MKKITIITPVLNHKKYIRDCLDSVVSQATPEIEHLIIDGGSTDGSLEIYAEYMAKYSHIRLISEKDKGQADAMNKGIRNAEAPIISFLNADDYYAPNTIARALELSAAATGPRPKIYFGNCTVLNGDEADKLMFQHKPKQFSLDGIFRFWKNNFPINPSTYFYEKKIHDMVGPYVQSVVALDYEFLFRLAKVTDVVYVDENWGFYRHYTGTITNTSIKEGGSKKLRVRIVKMHLDLLPIPNKIIFGLDYLRWKLLDRSWPELV